MHYLMRRRAASQAAGAAPPALPNRGRTEARLMPEQGEGTSAEVR